MNHCVLTGLLLAAALPLFAQDGGRQQFDLFGGNVYNEKSPALRIINDGPALLVSGTASEDGGGYVIESRENLEFSGKKRLIIKVDGVKTTDKTDKFDASKLLKLELGNKPQTTVTAGMKNRNDPTYINARNGEAVFDISGLRNIRKINLVFFNCTVEGIKIEVFYE
jgi:hypothetical protein